MEGGFLSRSACGCTTGRGLPQLGGAYLRQHTGFNIQKYFKNNDLMNNQYNITACLH